MLKKLILSIMIFSVIGVVFPSASADVFIHKPTPQFSIQHPNGWTVQEFPEYRLVSIDADATGRNGVSIMLVCSNLYGEDCGTPQADYQEIEF